MLARHNVSSDRGYSARPGMLAQFACADFGKSILWRGFGILALFYIVEVLGVDARMAGMILLASLAFDAVSDPVAGNLIDAWLRRGHGLRPFYLIAPGCAGVLLCVLFSLHMWGGGAVPVAVVFICLLLFRLAYTFVDVPANLASAACHLNGRGQTLLWSTKRGFAQIASLIVAFGLAPSIKDVHATGNSDAIVQAMLLLATLTVASYAVSARALPGADAFRAGRNGRDASCEIRGMQDSLLCAARNPALVRLGLMVLSVGALCDMLAAGVVFLDRGGVGGQSFAAQAVIALAAGASLAVPAGLAAGLKLGQGRPLRLASITIAVGALAFYLLPQSMPASRLAALALYGCGLGMAPLAYWSMAKSAIAYGPRAGTAQCGAGLAMALLSAAVKIGGGINAAILGFALHAAQSPRLLPPNAVDGMLLEPILVTATLAGACTCYALGGWLERLDDPKHAARLPLQGTDKATSQ